jgi:hypothetical protein
MVVGRRIKNDPKEPKDHKAIFNTRALKFEQASI